MNNKEKRVLEKLINMLSYKRPEGSIYQEIFNKRFLFPLMGEPDQFNNYVAKVTSKGKLIPRSDFNLFSKSEVQRIAFMAHHDTVHKEGGFQKVKISGDFAVSDSNCLGADCTTGCWLILEMIKARVPGIYVIHSGEECGGIGSSSLVESNPKWISELNCAISFDRRGTGSVITHQLGGRSCSDQFAKDLCSILDLSMKLDKTGVYTDSAEYIYAVPECTNISVGYGNEHTSREYQNLEFAMMLRAKLISADWSQLGVYKEVEEYYGNYSNTLGFSDYDWDKYYSQKDNKGVHTKREPRMSDLVAEFPEEIADILMQYGYTYEMLEEEISSYTG